MKFKCNTLILGALVSLCFASCGGGNTEDYGLIPVKQNDKWGYINNKGVFVINPQFQNAECFFDNVARVVDSDGKIGYISKDGSFAINPVYENGTRFNDGSAMVMLSGGKIICIDTKGNQKFALPDEVVHAGMFSNSIALISDAEKSGYVDVNGNAVISRQYESGFYLNDDGLVGIVQNSKIGFADMKGTLAINPQFDNARVFHEGLCSVLSGEKWGFINKEGKYEINPQFDQAGNFNEGLCRIFQGSQWGYIDRTGKIVINPQFEEGYDFKNSLALIKQNGKYGFIDKEGKIVINPQFDGGSNFYGNIALAVLNGKIGLINKEGKFEVNPQFDDIATPDDYSMFVAPKQVQKPSLPLMNFRDGVFQDLTAKSDFLDKPISSLGKLQSSTYQSNTLYTPGSFAVNGVETILNFYICEGDLRNGQNQSAKILSSGLVLQFTDNVSENDINKYIDDYMEYICYEKFLYDCDEFGPDFGHGITQYGHYMTWVLNSKKFLSYFIDRQGQSVTIYSSKNAKFLDKLKEAIIQSTQNDLAGESIENMF